MMKNAGLGRIVEEEDWARIPGKNADLFDVFWHFVTMAYSPQRQNFL